MSNQRMRLLLVALLAVVCGPETARAQRGGRGGARGGGGMARPNMGGAAAGMGPDRAWAGCGGMSASQHGRRRRYGLAQPPSHAMTRPSMPSSRPHMDSMNPGSRPSARPGSPGNSNRPSLGNLSRPNPGGGGLGGTLGGGGRPGGGQLQPGELGRPNRPGAGGNLAGGNRPGGGPGPAWAWRVRPGGVVVAKRFPRHRGGQSSRRRW